MIDACVTTKIPVPRIEAGCGDIYLKLKTIVPLMLTLGGALSIHLFLFGLQTHDSFVLPLFSLWVGAILCSLSIILSYVNIKEDTRTIYLALLTLYVLSFSLYLVYTTRFSVLSGVASPDIIGEYAIARSTLESGRWPLLSGHRYSTCLSVTVLPAIFSTVSGFDLSTVFRIALPAVLALSPVFLFIIAREIFGDMRLSFLAAALLSVDYFYINILTGLMRQGIAQLAVLISIYALAKRRSIGSSIVAILAMTGIVFDHYLIALIYLPILFLFALSSFFGKSPRKDRLAESHAGSFLIFYSVLLFAWSWLVSPALFNEEISIGDMVIRSILGLYKSPSHFFYANIAGSSRGLILTGWFDLQIVLIIVGVLYVLKNRRDPLKTAWVLSCCFMLAFLGGSYLFPIIGRAIFPARIYLIGYLFFAIAVASLLERLERNRNLRVFFYLFLLLSLSMNMLLPNTQGLLLYNNESSLTPEQIALQTPLYLSDFKLVNWVETHVPLESKIAVDIFGSNVLALSPRDLGVPVNQPIFFGNAKMLLLHEYATKYGIWVIHSKTDQRLVEYTNAQATISNSNVVYANGHFTLILNQSAVEPRIVP